MLMRFRAQLQIEEALGETNRYFCCKAYNQEVRDDELLVRYYIESGGAEDFERRFRHAMSNENRWYCSEFYLREVSDPWLLWHYYMYYAPLRAAGKISRFDPAAAIIPQNIAC